MRKSLGALPKLLDRPEGEVFGKVQEIIGQTKGQAGALIQVLQQTQGLIGYLPADVLSFISQEMKVPPSEVYGVVSFYAQFKQVPSGKRIVRVCRGTACHVRGGARILREVEKRLGVKQGETTGDLEYTLETVACIGACALAPTMTVDKETHGQMTTRKVVEVFGDRGKAE